MMMKPNSRSARRPYPSPRTGLCHPEDSLSLTPDLALNPKAGRRFLDLATSFAIRLKSWFNSACHATHDIGMRTEYRHPRAKVRRLFREGSGEPRRIERTRASGPWYNSLVWALS